MHEQSLSPVCRICIPACAMLWTMTPCEAMDEPDILTPLLEAHHDPRGDFSEAILVSLGITVLQGVPDTAKARHEITLSWNIKQEIRLLESPCLMMRRTRFRLIRMPSRLRSQAQTRL